VNEKKDGQRISELTLQEIFQDTLTDTPCVYIDKGKEVSVATDMCAQYLESEVDSIVVLDARKKPAGIVGGYDLLDNLRRYPTREFQYMTKVEEIMFKGLPQIDRESRLKNLIEKWNNSRRAFAVIPHTSGDDYSVISARKMLEVCRRYKTGVSLSSMPKKKIVTFRKDDPLGKILDLMYENKTRKVLLEGSNQFVSDRLILSEISRILRFREDVEYFLDIPAKELKLDYVRKIDEDLDLGRLCSMIDKMAHPYIVYKDTVVTPWDVTLVLSESIVKPLEDRTTQKCPHCGQAIPNPQGGQG
jgi:predicted transcriptional regulator